MTLESSRIDGMTLIGSQDESGMRQIKRFPADVIAQHLFSLSIPCFILFNTCICYHPAFYCSVSFLLLSIIRWGVVSTETPKSSVYEDLSPWCLVLTSKIDIFAEGLSVQHDEQMYFATGTFYRSDKAHGTRHTMPLPMLARICVISAICVTRLLNISEAGK